ncbi:MAG: hypothetical protein GQ574_29010 [Crocinitomix sp.]|nr:hypothetical protein [Crocinitomix sp.]
MVKSLLFIFALIISHVGFNQNLSLGLGGTANFSRAIYNSEFNFDVLTPAGDTLILEANNIDISKSISLPIFARYTAKKNWWIQMDYGYETWRFDIDGQASPTAYTIDGNVNDRLAASWAIYSGGLDSVSFRNEFYEAYQQNEEDENLTEFNSFERVQYNKLSVAFGSQLNKKGAIQFYYGLGSSIMTTSTFESHQGLVFENDLVLYQNEILDAFPKLTSFQIAHFINFGLERQNLRVGIDMIFHGFALSSVHEGSKNNVTQTNNVDSELVQRLGSFGVHLNYTFFNQNFNQIISDDKRAILDPVVIGRYNQKPKLFQFGAAIDFPSLHKSGWSILEGYDLEDQNVELNTKLNAENDTRITGLHINAEDLGDYIYIEKADEDVFINGAGEIDTNVIFTTLFFDSGNINTIVKSPKFSGFVRINPHQLFSADLSLGYQNQIYGIVAYETKETATGEDIKSITRRLLYRENYHQITLGTKAYYQNRLNNVSKIGAHIGINYNLWLPGRFITEKGGANDSELLEDFHEYYLENDDADEWNKNINPDGDKGLFSKADYYNHTYEPDSEIAQQNSYHSDFSPYLINTALKRSFFEVRLGVDLYVENLKFTVFAERSVWKKKFLYNDLTTFGMSVSMFLN